MPDEQNPDDDDKFRPEAIAARVDQIGEETEADRMAREEEQKLLVRKKSQKKTGLQAAASKRLSKIGEAAVKRPSARGAVAQSDPLLDRAARAGVWIRAHSAAFAGIVGAVVVAVGGFAGWTYWQEKRNGDASVLLAQAFADEHGQVSTKEDDDDDSTAKPLYPTFKSGAERRDAALAKYRAVESKYAGTGAAILARLAEGSLLLDAGSGEAARNAYRDVKSSALAQADAEVRGRALEGIGFADELLAHSDEAEKDKHLDDAMTAFKELEAVDVLGFKELGMFHQARVLATKNDKAKAIELLKDLQNRVSGAGEGHPFSYLQFVVEDRLRDLDPTALPPKAPKMPPGGGGRGGGKVDTSDPKIQELIRQLQQQQSQGGGGAPIHTPLPIPPSAPQ